MKIKLYKSDKKNKKYVVIIDDKKVIYFGAAGYSDYLHHNDHNRMLNYLSRHSKNENWEISGIETPGFWSRYLLWNKPTLEDSIKDLKSRFGIKVKIA